MREVTNMLRNRSRREQLAIAGILLLCCYCALFPPRRINALGGFAFELQAGKAVAPTISRPWLLSKEAGVYRASNGTTYLAEVDGGRLFAELASIWFGAALLVLVPKLPTTMRWDPHAVTCTASRK